MEWEIPFVSLNSENRDAIVDEEVLDVLRNSPEIVGKIYKENHESTVQRPMLSENQLVKKCPITLTSQYPPNLNFSSISEAAEKILDKFLKNNYCDAEKARDLMYLKSSRSLAEPGEPVRLIAAQSIEESSTQITFNTFHFAGRGDMNVTLSIPLLREILMMASANIKTPSLP
jgi:DNA-directed RNA polymerase beta' subunit